MNKRVTTILFLSVFSLLLSAQVLKERRVYYLDCSYSMKTNDLWDKVRNNLKNAIENVNDETTELYVIPFADNALPHPTLKVFREDATPSGKKSLINHIDNLPMNKNTMTYHYIPIEDFYANRVDNRKVTYMFLMTDGQDEDSRQKAMNLLRQWGNRYANSNVYGFYVMLHDSAKNAVITQVANSQEHLWKVETADVNINLVRLQSNAIFNAKNDKYFDIPIYGKADKMGFNASFVGDCPYKVTKVEHKESALRIWVVPKVTRLPLSVDCSLNVAMTGGGQFDFLVTSKITVKCENKPERSLKIHVK